MYITFTNDITVTLVQACASDALVAQAARVSTGGGEKDRAGDAKLIDWLMRSRHGSPFEHNLFTFHVHAPIFVWREHMRHRVASYNEESGRYKVLEPTFYVPARERKLRQVGKAGAYTFEDGTNQQYALTITTLRRTCGEAYEAYVSMLSNGIAREVARTVLPTSVYSSAYVTMNARALMNFLSLRRNEEGSTYPSFPQHEIELVAVEYENYFRTTMPDTHAAFVKNGRVAP